MHRKQQGLQFEFTRQHPLLISALRCILAMTCSDTYPSAQSSACARCILANMPGHVPSNTGLRVYKVHPCFDMLRYLTSNADLMMNRILSQNHTLSADASSTTRNWLLALQTST
eukprot:335897-Pelagomonas_calceolata.AAC.1